MKRLPTALLLAAACASAACGGGPRHAATGAGAPDASAVFARYCANCHGAEGEGRPLGSLRTPSFKSDPVVGLTDEQLYNWVANGGSNMPSFKGTLGEEQMRALVRHVRELQRKR